MRHIYAFLALCHTVWPTSNGIKHNITLGGDMRLVVTIHYDLRWHSFEFYEDAFVDPAAMVEGMKEHMSKQPIGDIVYLNA